MTAVESLLVVRGQALMAGSTPDRTRTCDLRFRKPTLYPPELRGRLWVFPRCVNPNSYLHGNKRTSDGIARNRSLP